MSVTSSRREDCPLCSQDLGPIVAEYPHWLVVVNREQSLLGKCFAVLRRHVEDVGDLTTEEWVALQDIARVGTEALRLAFGADHANMAFLGNADRHVHLHLRPRYATPRDFAGTLFEDPDFGDESVVLGEGRYPDRRTMDAIARALRKAWLPITQPPSGV